jgi:hypothetical protein
VLAGGREADLNATLELLAASPALELLALYQSLIQMVTAYFQPSALATVGDSLAKSIDKPRPEYLDELPDVVTALKRSRKAVSLVVAALADRISTSPKTDFAALAKIASEVAAADPGSATKLAKSVASHAVTLGTVPLGVATWLFGDTTRSRIDVDALLGTLSAQIANPNSRLADALSALPIIRKAVGRPSSIATGLALRVAASDVTCDDALLALEEAGKWHRGARADLRELNTALDAIGLRCGESVSPAIARLRKRR